MQSSSQNHSMHDSDHEEKTADEKPKTAYSCFG